MRKLTHNIRILTTKIVPDFGPKSDTTGDCTLGLFGSATMAVSYLSYTFFPWNNFKIFPSTTRLAYSNTTVLRTENVL